LYAHLLSLICVTCPACLILLDLIKQIFSEENRSLSSSFCIFLHSPHTLSLVGLNITVPRHIIRAQEQSDLILISFSAAAIMHNGFLTQVVCWEERFCALFQVFHLLPQRYCTNGDRNFH
jgi:hypothetical protein